MEMLEKLQAQKSTLEEICKEKKLNKRERVLIEAGYDLAVQFVGFLELEKANGNG